MTASPVVLIADDEPLLTELLEYRLGARGYQTVVAHDGREALAKLDEAEPQAVVLDMMMPVHDGFEVLRRMRASAKYAEFGPFYTGVHFSSSQLGAFLSGHVPQLVAAGL